MCGRFVSSTPPDELARYFDAVPAHHGGPPPSFNVAPTSEVYVVVEDAEHVRHLDAFRWGLVPPWADGPAGGSRLINARAETVDTRNAFRSAFRNRRCIVPADGFYEWTKVAGHKRKQPWYIHRPDGEPYAFAGLWERWRRRGSDEPWLLTCTVITGAANPRMAELHDRMPVVLPPASWEAWLDPDLHDPGALRRLLVPTPAELVTFHPVSTDVNTATNQGPHLVDEVAVIDPDGRSAPGTALG